MQIFTVFNAKCSKMTWTALIAELEKWFFNLNSSKHKRHSKVYVKIENGGKEMILTQYFILSLFSETIVGSDKAP